VGGVDRLHHLLDRAVERGGELVQGRGAAEPSRRSGYGVILSRVISRKT
jgi:hypothetical protein